MFIHMCDLPETFIASDSTLVLEKNCAFLGILDKKFLYNAICEPCECICCSDFHMVSEAVFLNVHISYVLNKQANGSFALESR